jgi:hypothetical protein
MIKASGPVKYIDDFKTKLTALKGSGGFRRDPNSVSWNNVAGASEQLFGILQSADMSVTTQTKQAVTDLELMLKKVNEAWRNFLTVDLPAFNKGLKSKGMKPITP